VPGLELGGCPADRLAAIGNFDRARRGGENGRTDLRRILAARIVIGHDDPVRAFRRNTPHDRALAGIAVAAGAEYHGERPPGVGTQALESLLERVRLVRIVDEDRRAAAVADELQPALGAGEVLERGENARRLRPGRKDETRRKPGILHLERADKRKSDFVGASAVHDVHDLSEPLYRPA